jgi:hypothetical protein
MLGTGASQGLPLQVLHEPALIACSPMKGLGSPGPFACETKGSRGELEVQPRGAWVRPPTHEGADERASSG